MSQNSKYLQMLSIGCLVCILLSSPAAAWVKTRVNITSGGYDVMRNGIAEALSCVLQEANKLTENTGDLQSIRHYFTSEGFNAVVTLLQNTGFYTMESRYETNLLITADRKKYEVRNIDVREIGRASCRERV